MGWLLAILAIIGLALSWFWFERKLADIRMQVEALSRDRDRARSEADGRGTDLSMLRENAENAARRAAELQRSVEFDVNATTLLPDALARFAIGDTAARARALADAARDVLAVPVAEVVRCTEGRLVPAALAPPDAAAALTEPMMAPRSIEDVPGPVSASDLAPDLRVDLAALGDDAMVIPLRAGARTFGLLLAHQAGASPLPERARQKLATALGAAGGLALGHAEASERMLADNLTLRREKAGEEKRREQTEVVVRRSFGTTMADYILRNHGMLEPRRYEQMTIYFSDIEGFTTISESMRPEEMVEILNEYLSRVTEHLREDHGGEISQYIGDAVMAYWGAPLAAPDGAIRACVAALEAVAVMDAYSEELAARGKPRLRTRIGINTGPAVAGLIGHSQRQSFAAMGDTVNTASRFEGANKVYGSTIIIGPETWAVAKDVILARELDLVRMKGKKKALRVYELMAAAGDPAPKKRELKTRYENALADFRAQKFGEAKRQLDSIAAEFGDPASKRLALCCDEWIRTPPPRDWDGSSDLTEK